jgi:hypothetical protein
MLQPLNALFYFMAVEIIKRFYQDGGGTFIEVFFNTKNTISFNIDNSIGLALDIDTAEFFLKELKKQINYAKKGGSNE